MIRTSAPESVTIRPMGEEDLPQVINIDSVSFSLPWPSKAFNYELKNNPDSLLWVAEITDQIGRNKVVGMIVIWLILDEAHIATIAIQPEFRGRGIASQLVLDSLLEVTRQGLKRATLEVRANNLAAQKLYRNFGFEVVGRRPRYYRDNHEDALLMTVQDLEDAYPRWLDQSIQ